MIYRPNRLGERRGVVAVVVALSLVALLGVVALTADGGMTLAEHRTAQAAADAAALAGATDLFEKWWQASRGGFDGPDHSAVASARAVAQAAGFQDGVNSTVTVNVPGGLYQGGPKAGQVIPPGYVEVLIDYRQPAVFSRIFSSAPIPVRARSVAQSQWVFAPPIVVLDPDIPDALTLSGSNGNVRVPNGPVYVNSSSPSAMTVYSAGRMEAPQFNVVGGASGGFDYHPNPNYPATGYLRTGTHPVADPLLHIPAPDPAALPARTRPIPVGGVYNLFPGRYVGGLRFSDLPGPPPVVNMAPGIYYMDGGGFIFNSAGGRLNAPGGVMIFNHPVSPLDVVLIIGTGTVTMRPLPASYSIHQGITVFQDRAAPVNPPVSIAHFATPNKYDIKGAIYAANAWVLVQRQNGDPSVGEQFIARKLTLIGTGDMFVPGNYVFTRHIGGVE
jgi:hypothetical protein